MELLVTATVLALLIYGLQRNHLRQADHPHPRLAGSTDIPDRDTDRLTQDLLPRDPTRESNPQNPRVQRSGPASPTLRTPESNTRVDLRGR